ncbi:glycoside hydrolase family 32 protein [Bacillus kexueae]|uniref:glycoside hydrolase family 32 protein n=1 Tax=Aeribacillus kexueae TaxID=2078952 RepID=UPI001FAF4699|nr:sucrose-6-phosphate hydrolase [Bacillus kexueae]
MEWTREQRYTRIEEVSEEMYVALEEKVKKSKWRQTFHIQPPTGLLNDPNGFSYYNGEYHLFYQWFPLGPVHGIKYWYHTKSKDLVHWENVGIAIRPNDAIDSHGAYSGSGIEHEGKLHLFYTGNTRDEQWIRHPYQCLAVMDDQLHIVKRKQAVIEDVPTGYTEHFRDPKVWKHKDTFYMLIGAQRENETGCVVLYSSKDLLNWSFEGEIKTTLDEFGYMWECPDYFELDGKGVLIFSPQGLESIEDAYQNIYQSGYLTGDELNLETKTFSHDEFHELDRGFDFYAPQTMVDVKGRRILVGWMGLPEIEYPTDVDGWAHCLTLPRELSIQNGKLIQRPIRELEKLRKSEHQAEFILKNEKRTHESFNGTRYELICDFTNKAADQFGIEIRASSEEKTTISFDVKEEKLIFDRTLSGVEVPGKEYGTIRKCHVKGESLKLHIFVDTSSVELFVNDGEEVFTSRIFPKQGSDGIRFFANGGEAVVRAKIYELSSMNES